MHENYGYFIIYTITITWNQFRPVLNVFLFISINFKKNVFYRFFFQLSVENSFGFMLYIF